MQIKQQYCVDGQCFDTLEQAEKYIEENHDRVRLDAFIQHLRATGTQRVTETVIRTVERFMAFEAGTSEQPKQEEAPVEEPEEDEDKEIPSKLFGESDAALEEETEAEEEKEDETKKQAERLFGN